MKLCKQWQALGFDTGTIETSTIVEATIRRRLWLGYCKALWTRIRRWGKGTESNLYSFLWVLFEYSLQIQPPLCTPVQYISFDCSHKIQKEPVLHKTTTPEKWLPIKSHLFFSFFKALLQKWVKSNTGCRSLHKGLRSKHLFVVVVAVVLFLVVFASSSLTFLSSSFFQSLLVFVFLLFLPCSLPVMWKLKLSANQLPSFFLLQ